MSKPPLMPANWKLTREMDVAHKKPALVFDHGSRCLRNLGKEIPAFNGSQTNRKTKKRPVTLPQIDWPCRTKRVDDLSKTPEPLRQSAKKSNDIKGKI